VKNKLDTYHQTIRELLLGKVIRGVYYEEIDYEDNKPYYPFSLSIHSVDLNVIFHTDSSEYAQIKWDNMFECYGLAVEKIDKLNYRESISTINLSDDPAWKDIIGLTIQSVNVYWTEIFIGEPPLPATWEVTFENNTKVWIAAFEEPLLYPQDHLTLFFDKSSLEAYLKFDGTEEIVTIK